MRGRHDQDPLFLQIKEAQPPVLERFTEPSQYGNCGERVVAGQRLMQAASDSLPGVAARVHASGVQRDFYVRQLRDSKMSVDIEGMPQRSMSSYARACGWTLARAHARSGDRMAICAYLGRGTSVDDAVALFAQAYADQNERDYQALKSAVADGRVTAVAG
jgi:hypothetical protein